MKMAKIIIMVMSALFLLGGELWAGTTSGATAQVSRPRTTREKSIREDKGSPGGVTRLSGRRESVSPVPKPTFRRQAPQDKPRDRFDSGPDGWPRGY